MASSSGRTYFVKPECRKLLLAKSGASYMIWPAALWNKERAFHRVRLSTNGKNKQCEIMNNSEAVPTVRCNISLYVHANISKVGTGIWRKAIHTKGRYLGLILVESAIENCWSFTLATYRKLRKRIRWTDSVFAMMLLHWNICSGLDPRILTHISVVMVTLR